MAADLEPAHRPVLQALASRMGITDSYLDQSGGEVRHTSDDNTVLLLAAMGVDASTEELAVEELRALRRAKRHEWIASVRVIRQRSRALTRVRVRVPASSAESVRWRLVLTTEEGLESTWSGSVRGGRSHRDELTLPVVPPLGYHRLTVTFDDGARQRTGRQRLIVVPSHCTPPEARLQGRRGFGLTANLYAVRSDENWGAGDLGDIRTLATWLGEHGGAFVGMSPLHAIRNAGYDVSPYSPISRLFRNPLYLRVDDIPELAFDDDARACMAEPAFAAALSALRVEPTLHYERIMALRAPVLQSLHRVFVARDVASDSPRARAYGVYRAREEPELTHFATFMAISEREGPDARIWPEPLRNAHGVAVHEMRERLADRVDYHRWLQFEIDRQLGSAASAAAEAGLALGMYQDLAVGSAPSGSDVWSHPSLFTQQATVGAPPDMYSAEGQNWGLPAIDPHVLRATGYDYWTRLLRAGFRHAGALRIDHALGLFRMFWVPVGQSAKRGTFVRSFARELFGILALESVRHGALVVGEDLGTVPPEVPGVLAKWGVLSSKVLVFEREFHTGRFRDASEYPRMALATVDTHDLPPLAGWLEGRDIELRSQFGDLADESVADCMRRVRAGEVHALIESLRSAGLLPAHEHHQLSPVDLIKAMHAFIRRTPSALVGLSLDDLALESMPVNIPGVWQDRYPSWSRRIGPTLVELLANARTAELLGAPPQLAERQ